MRAFWSRVVNALVVLVVVAAVVTAAGCGGGARKASPQRVAGDYVRTLAANSHVRIVGDKVWRTFRQGDYTVVVVRVRYVAYVLAGFGIYAGPTYEGVTTIFVRELRSDYTVIA